MKSPVFVEAGNVISSLGPDLEAHMEAVQTGKGGITMTSDPGLSPTELPLSLVDWQQLEQRFSALGMSGEYSRFERLSILAARWAVEASTVNPKEGDTMLILSTTKGNVEGLSEAHHMEAGRLSLWSSAEKIASSLGMKTRPLVISNACISGVVALLKARRLILEGKCRHVLVLGADVASRFVISGFQSFMSLSESPCRPYDQDRNGLSLGEAAAAMIISADYGDVQLEGGAISNDANHISGPSRTGEGLYRAIMDSLPAAGGELPHLISAHGTATAYNDEMEAIALDRAGLSGVPVNSLKGYMGHTLGAAGIVESLLNVEALRRGLLIPTLGYGKHGVSRPMNIIREAGSFEGSILLKLASGFGGSNAAAVFRRRS